MGELIKEDISNLIDVLYPDNIIPNPLDRERWEQGAYARSRFDTYIGRNEYFQILNKHVESNSEPLVILGESGIGKSALIANWTASYRDNNDAIPVILHFVGATSRSASLIYMLRRIMGELKRTFKMEADIPDDSEEIKHNFANWLYMAAAKGRCLIIIDALNQLEDMPGALDLTWLPPKMPENIRLILSTLPGRPLEELTKREWATLTVEPLTKEEKIKLIVEYLKSKTLEEPIADRLAKAKQCENPLYLRVLLEEIKLWGEHDTLGKQINHYLNARNPEELYDKVLERCEEDYERDCPDLTRNFMAYIYSSRKGLTEQEIADLLGNGIDPLPRPYWTHLFLALEKSLVKRAGFIDFFHEHLKKAVEKRYLQKEEAVRESHMKLANYFDEQEMTPRKIEELPWQLSEGCDWGRLFNLLSDIPFFSSVWDQDEFDVKRYWAKLEKHNYTKVRAYKSFLDNPGDDEDCACRIAMLFQQTGNPYEAFLIWEYFTKVFKETGDKANYQAFLGNQLTMYRERGDFLGAIELLREVEKICLELENYVDLAKTWGNAAMIFFDQGNLARALELNKREEKIWRKIGSPNGIQHSLGNQALILQNQGDLTGAMRLLKESEKICREIGNTQDLQASFRIQATVLREQGDFNSAMHLLKEQEKICREIGNSHDLQASLNNQANIHLDLGDLEVALTLLKEQERVCREVKYPQGLADSMGDQGLILRRQGDLAGAMKLLKEEERLGCKIGNPESIQKSLGNQALVSLDKGDFLGAMKLLKEQEGICREHGEFQGLIASLYNQANILQDQSNFEEALKLLRETEKMSFKLGNNEVFLDSLASQANILVFQGDHVGAMAALKKIEKICRKIGDTRRLAPALGYQASILQEEGDLTGAMKLHKETENICRKIENPEILQVALGEQAITLIDLRDFEEALKISEEREVICRELGNQEGILSSLKNQVTILIALDIKWKALDLMKEIGEMGDIALVDELISIMEDSM